MSERETGQIHWGPVPTDFHGTVHRLRFIQPIWRVQIFNLRGSLVKDYRLGFLPGLLNMITGASAIYTRVR